MKTIDIIKFSSRVAFLCLALNMVLTGMNGKLFAQECTEVPVTVEVDSTENVILKIDKPSIPTNRIYIKVGTQYLGEDIYKKTFSWGDVSNPNNTEVSADDDHIRVVLDSIPSTLCHFSAMLHCGDREIHVGRISKDISELNQLGE